MNQVHYEVEIDSVSENEWSAMLTTFEDANIYQTWSYGSVRWSTDNLSHLILRQNGELVAIAQLRIVQPSKLKFGVAYLRWGPLCQPEARGLELSVVREMAQALWDEYVRKRGLYLEILPNAFLGTSRAEVLQAAFSRFDRTPTSSTEKHRTLLVDLRPGLGELRKNLDKKWRNQLNASERNGLEITASDSVEYYLAFCAVYKDMWKRKQFKTSVSIEEFALIQERLPKNQRMQIFLCKQNGQCIAGVVCSALGQSGIYLLGATIENGMKLKASYLVQWTVIKWLKENGIRYYDLGGIDPVDNPGVYHFKSGFSGADLSHMNALVACDNALSTVFAAAGHIMYRNLRRLHHAFVKARMGWIDVFTV